MRKTIQRSITTTRIHAFYVKVNEEGIPEVINLEPVTVFGTVSKAKAVKAVATAYPDVKGIDIAKIETAENLYEISVGAFVANATIIEKETV